MKLNVKLTDVFENKKINLKSVNSLVDFFTKEVNSHFFLGSDPHIFRKKTLKLIYFNNASKEEISNLREFINYVDNKELDLYEKVRIISTYGSLIESFNNHKKLTYDVNKISKEKMYFLTNIAKTVSYDDYYLYQYVFLNPLVINYIFSSSKNVDDLIKDYFDYKFSDGKSIETMLNNYCMDMDDQKDQRFFQEATMEVLKRYKKYIEDIKAKDEQDFMMGM